MARHRTARDLERQRHQHEAVAELGRRALECTDPGELFETAATLVVDRLGCATARVVERKSADGRLVAVATASSGETEADPVSEPAATALAADALDQAGPVVLGDRAGEAGNAPQRQVADGVERGIGVAVGPADGHWGALTACGTAERPFSAHDVTFVQNVANVLGTAIERQVAERRMRDRDEQFREVAELARTASFGRTPPAGSPTSRRSARSCCARPATNSWGYRSRRWSPPRASPTPSRDSPASSPARRSASWSCDSSTATARRSTWR
nr:GAF domain-containing protein [Halomicroarcula sp. SYNS111]